MENSLFYSSKNKDSIGYLKQFTLGLHHSSSILPAGPNVTDSSGRCLAFDAPCLILNFIYIAISILGSGASASTLWDSRVVSKERLSLEDSFWGHIVNGMCGYNFVAHISDYTRLHGELAVLSHG